jgi:2-keto-4-pentenoate hydratase
MTTPAAQRLLDAQRTKTPCPPVRDLIGSDDVETSSAVQKQLGVDQPDFGVLFDDMDVSADDPVPMGGLLQPRVEAEVAFLLRADLTGDFTPADVAAAVEVMAPALEIVDSRIAGWDISIADTIADNASSALFVLGDQRVGLDALRPVDIQMEMSVDGAVVSKGSGAACLGDPLAALAWLAAAARDHGEPLREGQVVLSGALGPMVPVTPGMQVTATLSGLGTVSANFGEN